MFGLGLFEMIIILLAVVLFVKPNDLPKFVRKVGQVYGHLQEMYQMFVNQLRSAEHQIRDEIEKVEEAVIPEDGTEKEITDIAKKLKKLKNKTTVSKQSKKKSPAKKARQTKVKTKVKPKIPAKKRVSKSSPERVKAKTKTKSKDKPISKKKPILKKTPPKVKKEVSKKTTKKTPIKK